MGRSPSRGGEDERRRNLLLQSWSSDEETEDEDDEEEECEDFREEGAKAWEEEDESDSGYGKESAPQRDSGFIDDQSPSFSHTVRTDGEDGWHTDDHWDEESEDEENPFYLAHV